MLLLAAPVAQARVVVVATGTARAALIDIRTRVPALSPRLPGATRAVAAAPDGSRAYVSAGRGVAMIDLNSGLVVGGLPVQGVPAALAVSPDGQRLYAARKGGIEVIDPLGINSLGVLMLAGTPLDLAVTATRAVVVQRDTVAILDLQTGHVVKRRTLAGAAGVDIDDDG